MWEYLEYDGIERMDFITLTSWVRTDTLYNDLHNAQYIKHV